MATSNELDEQVLDLAIGNRGAEEFISDPNKPVPYSEDIKMVFTPRKYMTDDQRFAARRPDVLVYETEVLEEDLTLAGEVLAKLTGCHYRNSCRLGSESN